MQSEEKGERPLSLRPENRGKLSSYEKALWGLGPAERTWSLLYRSHWERVYAVSRIELEFIYLRRTLCESCLNQQSDSSREPVPRRINCGVEDNCWTGSGLAGLLMPMVLIAGYVSWASLLPNPCSASSYIKQGVWYWILEERSLRSLQNFGHPGVR